MTEDMITQAETDLTAADPLLGSLIKKQRLDPIEPRGEYFASLARSIIGQQVSVAAARAIALRFAEHTNLDPLKAAVMTDESARAIGLSRQKTNYIRDLAQHFAKNPSVFNHLETIEDESVITELTAVKGVGVWTAQMFLMFTLNRPDVFAPDDAGLQRAMLQLYKWDTLPSRKDLVLTAQKWQPYRTIASLHLWQSLDNNPA